MTQVADQEVRTETPVLTARDHAATRWPLSRIINISVAVLALYSVAAVAVGVIALTGLADARTQLLDRIDPAQRESLRLESALVNQETGVRGYALAAQRDLLVPYTDGRTATQDAAALLDDLVGGLPDARADLRDVLDRVDNWRVSYAEPAIAAVDTTGRPVGAENIDAGTTFFDQVRAAVADLQADLDGARERATAALDRSATALNVACVGIAVGFALMVLLLAIGLRRAAIRPVSKLAAEVRTVADGDFRHEVGQSGPREVRELGADVNTMRVRILHELSALQDAHDELDARTQDLQRSNTELEQFAYVASHDLQEPLRKVASFCQLLDRRYHGQLDERADQYIAFAVDGAKRMQVLINDLLAFSRVGRTMREPVEVSCEAVLEQAKANLATAIERAGATVESGQLPTVMAEVPLLTTVFQNLVGNALKFRGEAPPRVRVSAVRDERFWELSVSDNGIGIAPEYAERIFVIFQRLHGKGEYPGTGIGLAMCRKIIDYHGGRIWLDTDVSSGARFCFTLPVLTEEDDIDG
ncbi:MAG: HAMP domain-containing protein [Actinophytocola sp.]|uniref:sensor histidine kinase n=1 Tax=Actinophytocola sp. TaxID=1872138 RepID=UPI001322147F|nr:ATP-binding protein [Actinophytocola sp.]MPZ81585.1 HAMP domain-containing protein [Actinophytocola sp.]